MSSSGVAAVVVVVVVLALVSACVSADCFSYSAEKLNEGVRYKVYYDTMGHPTIGVGLNLDASASAGIVSSCTPYTVKQLIAGQTVTDSQVQCMFNKSIGPAQSCANSIVGGGSSSGAWGAVADMAFNMGCGGVQAFHNMIAAIKARNWNQAAAEMQNSKWCGQVHSRCDRDMACMRRG